MCLYSIKERAHTVLYSDPICNNDGILISWFANCYGRFCLISEYILKKSFLNKVTVATTAKTLQIEVNMFDNLLIHLLLTKTCRYVWYTV